MIRAGLVAALLAASAPAAAQEGNAQQASDKKETPEVKRRSIGEQAGVRRSRIPPALQAAFDAPYSRQNTQSCAALAVQIRALDRELGADLDSEPYKAPNDMTYYARRAGDVLLGPISMARDIAGEITGARKSRDRVEAATIAGAIRRGYLKGLGTARGCRVPAAPTAAAMRATPLPAGSEEERDRREDAAEGRRDRRN